MPPDEAWAVLEDCWIDLGRNINQSVHASSHFSFWLEGKSMTFTVGTRQQASYANANQYPSSTGLAHVNGFYSDEWTQIIKLFTNNWNSILWRMESSFLQKTWSCLHRSLSRLRCNVSKDSLHVSRYTMRIPQLGPLQQNTKRKWLFFAMTFRLSWNLQNLMHEIMAVHGPSEYIAVRRVNVVIIILNLLCHLKAKLLVELQCSFVGGLHMEIDLTNIFLLTLLALCPVQYPLDKLGCQAALSIRLQDR